MAFSIAGRAKPRGAARPCSHSCSVRFEICNFNAASFCERLFRSRHARSLRGNAPAANLWCRTCSGSVPKAILRCYTWITYRKAILRCYTWITYSIKSELSTASLRSGCRWRLDAGGGYRTGPNSSTRLHWFSRRGRQSRTATISFLWQP